MDERLTKRFENGRAGLAGNGTPCENMCKYPIVLDHLAAYEDLGTVEELAALKERMRWIPVSERLPDSEADVLAITKQFGIAVSRYHRSLNYPQLDSGWFCHSQRVSVTHWMSLPEAPKEADHADS